MPLTALALTVLSWAPVSAAAVTIMPDGAKMRPAKLARP